MRGACRSFSFVSKARNCFVILSKGATTAHDIDPRTGKARGEPRKNLRASLRRAGGHSQLCFYPAFVILSELTTSFYVFSFTSLLSPGAGAVFRSPKYEIYQVHTPKSNISSQSAPAEAASALLLCRHAPKPEDLDPVRCSDLPPFTSSPR